MATKQLAVAAALGGIGFVDCLADPSARQQGAVGGCERRVGRIAPAYGRIGARLA